MFYTQAGTSPRQTNAPHQATSPNPLSLMTFFESWPSLGQTALQALLAYAALIVLLRTSGKRTLAKLNAFDLVVTVALGSTLASIVTSDRLPLANGVMALGMLIALQYVVAWVTLRAAWFHKLVKSGPTLLVYEGRIIDEALRRTRIARDEILTAVRGSGVMQLEEVSAVVLEPDGSLSVLTGAGRPGTGSALRDVQRLDGRARSGREHA